MEARNMPPSGRGYRPSSFPQAHSNHAHQGAMNSYGTPQFYGAMYDSGSHMQRPELQQQMQRGFHGTGYHGTGYQPAYPAYSGYYPENPVPPVLPASQLGLSQRPRANSARSRSSESSITGPSSPTFETPEGAEDSPNRVKHADLVSEYFTAAAVPRGGSGEEDIERLINRTIEDLPTDELKQRSENSRHQQQSQQHKRRPNQGADTQSKFRKGFKQETYLLHVLDDDKGYFLSPLDVEAVAPAATLSDFEYREIFSLLGELFCRTSYRWLAQYRFRIPRKRYMKDHLFPADREMTEYVQIIKSLVEGREVPRNAVRDDRLTELVSVMEGAAEIRHVNIHVSRKQKPDRRVLGFIAAVNEFCWILGDYRAAIETNQLYTTTEQKILGRRQEDWPKPGSVMTSQMVEAN